MTPSLNRQSIDGRQGLLDKQILHNNAETSCYLLLLWRSARLKSVV